MKRSHSVKKKNHKVLWIILAVVVVVIVGGIIAVSSYISKMDERIASITINDVDLTQTADGTYQGAYDMFPVSVIVSVTVKDHAITDIELVKHTNGQGKAAEVLPGEVIKAQSLQVDAITGATYSSKVILKAIETALLQAEK